jgi:hypothetical protein
MSLTPEQAVLCRKTADEIRQFDRDLMQGAFLIGKKLIEVKEKLDHGQFGAWLQRDVGYSSRTAQNYMNVARHLNGKSETVSLLPLKTVYQIAALPASARVEVVDMITDPANPPVDEIKLRIGILARAAQREKTKEQWEGKKTPEQLAAAKAKELKATQRREAKERKEQEARERAEAERSAVIGRQARRWIDAIGLELAKEIESAMRKNGARLVEKAIRDAIASEAQKGSEDDLYEELADLDLSHVACL